MRRLKFFLLACLILCVVVATFFGGTEKGSQLLVQGASRLSLGALVVDRVEGRLFDAIKLAGIRLVVPGCRINIDRLGWSWLPSSLLNGQMHLRQLNLTGVDIFIDETEHHSETTFDELPIVFFPMLLMVERFELKGVRIVTEEENVVFTVNYLGAHLEGIRDSLVLEEFKLNTPDFNVELHGQIDTANDWYADLLGTWDLVGFGFHHMEGTFSASGPIADSHLEVGIHSPGAIRIKADVVDLFGEVELQANLTAATVDLSELIEYCPPIVLGEVTANFTGDFSGYSGTVKAKGEWEELTDLQLSSRLRGDWLGIDFDTLRIDRPGGYAEAREAKISWSEIFSWAGSFHFDNINPAIFADQLEGFVTADIKSRGDVVDDGVKASFDVVKLHGSLSEHPFTLSGNIFLSETELFTDGLTLEGGEFTGAATIGSAKLSWDDILNWTIDATFDQFNPGSIHPLFDGNVTGSVILGGQLSDAGLEGKLSINTLTGVVAGKNIFGSGEIVLADGIVQTPGLVLRSGSSLLQVEGNAEDELAVDFSFSSPDIGDLSPFATGSLQLVGSLSGKVQSPVIHAELMGKSLGYEEYTLQKIGISFNGEISRSGNFESTTRFEKFGWGGERLFDGQVIGQGSLSNHRIKANLKEQEGRLVLEARGSYDGLWTADIDHIVVDYSSLGRWIQEEPSSITYGTEEVSLSPLCLQELEKKICFAGSVVNEDFLSWSGQANWSSIPLNDLYRLGDVVSPIEGFLEGEVEVSGETDILKTLRSVVTVANPNLQFQLENDQLLPTQLTAALLKLDVVDTTTTAELSLGLADSGKLEMFTRVNGLQQLGLPLSSYLRLPLEGSLRLEGFNAGILAAYTNYQVEPTGHITSDLVIDGTVGQPEVYGRIGIDDGGVAIPMQGVILEDVSIVLEAGEEGARLNCRASSGPGFLVADGTLVHGEEGTEGDLTITGSDFLLVNLPEYTFRVSPDVRFRFSGNKGEITGSLDVPNGVIAPEEMTGSVAASQDVVLVNGTEEIRLDGWPFFLDLDVTIGDDVVVDGYGLKGLLGGAMNVKITPNDYITGNGELDLREGKFSIYGRTLDIERGRVLFSGGPIDNPGLDVRAKKTVSAESAKGTGYTVGVDISGLAHDLKFNLFSDPFMDDTEILSLMIVGHSFSGSTEAEGSLLKSAATTLGINGSSYLFQGLGNMLQIDDLHLEGSSKTEDVSLVVGKRVTDDLYIGYDMNMFSQLGQFRVRYDLTRGFSVETTSSSESTGADLLYSFER